MSAVVKAALEFQIVVTEASLRHRLGISCQRLDALDVCSVARQAGLRAKWYPGISGKIETLPLPILLCLNGQWTVIKKIELGYWLRYDLATNQLCREPLPFDDAYTNDLYATVPVVLLAEKEVQVTDVKFGVHWFLSSILRYVDQLRDILILSLLLQLIALITPILFQIVIDKVLVSRGLSSLSTLMLAMFTLAIAEPLYSYMRGRIFSNLAGKVNAELSARLYRHLWTLPLSYFCQRPTGQIVACVREINQVGQFLTSLVFMSGLDIIFIFLFTTVMFRYAGVLVCLILGSLILYVIFWLVVGPVLRHRVTQSYDAGVLATAYLTETITGMEILKTTATEHDFLRGWQKIFACQLRAQFSAKKVGIAAAQGISLIQKLTSAFLLWLGVEIVLAGKLTVGELVAFNMLASHVIQPILRLSQVWQDVQYTRIALRRIGDILDTEPEAESKATISVPELKGKIVFQHVRFCYRTDTPEVLSNLSFTIQAGEFVGITGPSGSGKSTLVRLLQRLYVLQHGQILVDGMDVAIIDPALLRRNMGVVLQNNMLFVGSILDNIKLCCCFPEVGEHEVIEAAQLAGADGFIRTLPQGYQTVIGERGSGLSGGQRQRIALARALLAKPCILILDEATSALDYESEAAIMANMDRICAKRTVISIAHRLSTIKYANRILVLDQGQVVEEGTHVELVQKQGLYANLWAKQTKDRL